MTREKIYIKSLDNKIGRFLVNYYYLTIFPLTILGFIVIGFIMEEPTKETSGKIIRSFVDVAIIKNNGKASLGNPSRKVKCLFIELNDSTKYMVMYNSFVNELKKKEIVGRNVQINYQLIERYNMPEVLAVFYYNDNLKEYTETLSPYRQVEKIVFDDGQVIESSKMTSSFIIIGFALSLIWLMCGLIEEIVKIWKLTPDRPTRLTTIPNIKNKSGKLISNFKNCPACGCRIKDTDNECPDCGLNFI